jgi:hypothetical protein
MAVEYPDGDAVYSVHTAYIVGMNPEHRMRCRNENY